MGRNTVFQVLFLISLTTSSANALTTTAEAVTTESTVTETNKNFSVNASVDIGKNTKDLLQSGGEKATEILEKLSKALGTTVEKVFPYYVKQKKYEGIYYTAGIIFSIVLLFIMTIFLYKQFLKKEKENSDSYTTFGVFTIIVFIIFLFTSIVGLCQIPSWMVQIQNPEFEAIQQIVIDAKNLTN
jgi:uncharacterized membrane protein